MIKKIFKIFYIFYNYLFPPSCVYCSLLSQENTPLCEVCERGVLFNRYFECTFKIREEIRIFSILKDNDIARAISSKINILENNCFTKLIVSILLIGFYLSKFDFPKIVIENEKTVSKQFKRMIGLFLKEIKYEKNRKVSNGNMLIILNKLHGEKHLRQIESKYMKNATSLNILTIQCC